jgi:hypothetical protein
MAHGYRWAGSGWTGGADAHFYDMGILSDVLGEAGIAFVTGWNWESQQGQMSAIGQGVVALGRKLDRGLAGLRQLLGSGVSLHRLDVIPCGAPACAPNQNVYYSSGFLNDSSSAWIAMTTVHELAHVIDWNGRIEVNGRMQKQFSNAWHGAPITEYAAGGVINRWERWAEAVTVYVYGDRYPNQLDVDHADQMARIDDMLNGRY